MIHRKQEEGSGSGLQLRKNYATVKIPVELASKLDAILANLGYSSRAEIVNDAIRRFLDDRRKLEVNAEEKPEIVVGEPQLIKVVS